MGFGPSRKFPMTGMVPPSRFAPMGMVQEPGQMTTGMAPPQMPQQPSASPIQAPKDRGMFGRFAGFNPLRFDPDKGVGEGNKLYAIGAALAGMGSGDPALTANLLEPKLQQNLDRVQKREEDQQTAQAEAQRQKMLEQMAGMTDDPRRQAFLRMGLGVEQEVEQAWARDERKPYSSETDAQGRPLAFDPNTGTYGVPFGDPKSDQRPWWAQEEGGVDPAQLANQAAGRSPGVSVFTGGAAPQSLQQIPDGTPIPAELLGLEKPDAGNMYVRDSKSEYGFRQVAMPGSGAEAKNASGLQAQGGRTFTMGTLIGSYATLAKNKAITAQGNTTAENAAALYSGTGVGQVQDRLGGEVGNLENAEARDTIQGLSMKALMDMISMSDVSAKAMDSDAEMKAWLTAVKSDNYESALTKLHVLDKSFGDGLELQRAYQNGVIDLNTYQHVTRRVNSDPMTRQMYDRAQRYAALGQAIGADNMTTGETSAIDGLLEYMTPEEQALFRGRQ